MAASRFSSNGPDVTDVVVMMQALTELHGVNVSLVMSPAGDLPDVRLSVVAIAERKNPTEAGVRRSVSRKRVFPSRDAKTLEGLIYRLLHELDMDCGTMWEQIVLPE